MRQLISVIILILAFCTMASADDYIKATTEGLNTITQKSFPPWLEKNFGIKVEKLESSFECLGIQKQDDTVMLAGYHTVTCYGKDTNGNTKKFTIKVGIVVELTNLEITGIEAVEVNEPVIEIIEKTI